MDGCEIIRRRSRTFTDRKEAVDVFEIGAYELETTVSLIVDIFLVLGCIFERV